MASSDVLSDSFLQILIRPRLGSAFWEQCPMNILRGIPTSSAHYDLSAFFIPLKYSSRPYAKLSADLGRDGDLAL
jgi:hypothetical protein